MLIKALYSCSCCIFRPFHKLIFKHMANFSLLNSLIQFLCAMALQSAANWLRAAGYLPGGLLPWTDERGEKLQ